MQLPNSKGPPGNEGEKRRVWYMAGVARASPGLSIAKRGRRPRALARWCGHGIEIEWQCFRSCLADSDDPQLKGVSRQSRVKVKSL
jgi:hypothetical protein